jgi:hypothetical protein
MFGGVRMVQLINVNMRDATARQTLELEMKMSHDFVNFTKDLVCSTFASRDVRSEGVRSFQVGECQVIRSHDVEIMQHPK